ncbi:MAG: type II secretion system protein GspJ [Pseudomonadota bacterium]
MTRPHAPRGFTLLELVVSLALFALVTVMALQVLSGALHQNRVLERADAQASDVLRAMALLRHDLNHASPKPFQTPIGDIEAAYLPGPDSFALSLGGLPRLPTTPGDSAQTPTQDAGFQRVIWRHDQTTGTLTRQTWPVLNPRDPAQIGPEDVVLTGVRGLTLTPGPEETANTNGSESDVAANTRDATGLPGQIVVEIETSQTGTLQIVVSPW